MELTELGLSEEQLTGVNTYLESQIQAKVQSEGDKIRTKYNTEITGYKTKIGDYDKTIEELQAKIPVTKTEEQIAMETRIKGIEEREAKALQKEKLATLNQQLTEKGLNTKLSKFLKVEGIEDLETYLGELVEVVGKPVTSTYQPKSHVTTNSNITKADFLKMSYNEKANLYTTDRTLYDSLSK